MKEFFKTTLIGGLLLMVPLGILAFILFKIFKAFYNIAEFVERYIPIESILGVIAVDILTVLLILIVCFLFGLLALSQKVKFFQDVIEKKLLMKIPGYIFYKTYTKEFTKNEENSNELDPVLIRFDDNYQLGFLIEENPTALSSVYIPGAPNPWSGSVIYVEKDRISQLNISSRQAIQHIQQAGKGIELINNHFKS